MSRSIEPDRGASPVPRRPLHPVWTHAPLGGLVAVVVFDSISAVDGNTDPWSRELYRAGTFVLMVATSLMALAIVSGLVDRVRGTAEGARARTRATLHGVLMIVVAVGSVLDIALRRQAYPDALHSPAAVVATTLITFGIAVVGGEVGGRLTYRSGVNVMSPPPQSSHQADVITTTPVASQ